MTDGGAVALFEVRRQIMMNGRKKRRKAVERVLSAKRPGRRRCNVYIVLEGKCASITSKRGRLTSFIMIGW